jgi:membrane fusion protein (multidrug efflux system)
MRHWQSIARWSVATVAAISAIVLMVLWLAGTFKYKISPNQAVAAPVTPHDDRPVVEVKSMMRPYAEWAVGTTRAVHETTLGSRLLAKVVAVNVHAGELVEKGAVLVELDDADLRAQVEQAQAVVAASSAVLDQSRTEFDRISKLIKEQAASQLELTRVTNGLRGAEADKRRADEALREVQTRLSYATIRSPMDGRIIEKRVDVGDTVTPGQPLVSMYDPTRMQLVAVVPESLAYRLAIGKWVGVRLQAMNKECEGRVEEIVPQAFAASRSFEVKVSGPCPPGVYPGMFGRIKIPLDNQEVIYVPRAAVREVGQLNLVDVVTGHGTERRLVRLGPSFDDNVEILSGLTVGEKVALPLKPTQTRPSDNGN